MKPLRAVIVEDEPSGMENLRWKLQKHCPGVEIVAECLSGQEAIAAIRTHLPDLLFLDIMLGDMTGFDVLKAIKHPSYEVIFTTSYDEYAIQAIKNNALDYLVKPVEVDELQEAVAKARSEILQHAGAGPAPVVASPVPARFGFPISTGMQFLDVQDVVYAKAEDNVAVLHLTDRKEVRLTKTLSWLEEQLANHGFCRVHNSYLINFNQMTEYIRNEGGYVIMSDGKAISVSRRRKDDFLNNLEKWEGNG
ncbi:MAG: response regulator transcription factor [Phaeodactylibacter sp.]|nr:response regulator transcription factor [Phaeodactylibacter sp.]